VSSGYIPAKDEPGPDEILEALREAVSDTPGLQKCRPRRWLGSLSWTVVLRRSLRPHLWRTCWTRWRPRREASRPTSSPRRATPREYETD
jgi:hypothetical protein